MEKDKDLRAVFNPEDEDGRPGFTVTFSEKERPIKMEDEDEGVLLPVFKRPIDSILDKDTRREAMSGVYFHKGALVATNGNILVRQNLAQYGFLTEHLEHIEGKFLLQSTFSKIRGFALMGILEDKIVCYTNDLKTRAEFYWHKLEHTYPDYEALLEKADEVYPVEKIGLNFKNLSLVSGILLEKGGNGEFLFTGENRSLLIKSIGYTWDDESILIMPVLLDEDE